MGIYKYLAIRTLNMVLIVILVMTLTFIMFNALYVDIKMQEIKQIVRFEISDLIKKGILKNQTDIDRYFEERVQYYIKAYELDKPWYARVWRVLYDLLTFNFGKAYYLQAESGGRDVIVIISERIPRTVLLLGTSTLITTILGLWLGLLAANRPQSVLDKSVIIVGLTSNAFAAWWVGLALQYLFAYNPIIPYEWRLPAFGIYDATRTFNSDFEFYIDVMKHMILPVSALVIVSFGGWALVVRNLLIGTLAEDFIMVARAKGLPENKILFGHALKSSAPPIITIIAFSVAGLFGGVIITETIFQWNGMGMMIWEALIQFDIPVILAFFYISTLLIILANFVADILYGIFDPRVKTG
jgi:peptide/nickel transport system permease protein